MRSLPSRPNGPLRKNKIGSGFSPVSNGAPAADNGLHLTWFMRLAPILFFELYLNFTVWLLAFGPCEWDIDNPLELYSFVIIAHLALFLGYLLGARCLPSGYRGPFSPKALVWTSIIVTLVWMGPNFFFSRTTIGGVEDIAQVVSQGLSDPSKSYAEKLSASTIYGGGPSALVRLSMPFLPIMALMFPLCIVYWKRLGFAAKFSCVLTKMLELLTWVAIGTTYGIATFFALLPWLLAAGFPRTYLRLTLMRVVLVSSVGLLCFILLFMYFTAAKIGSGESRPDVNYYSGHEIYGRTSYMFISCLPMRYRHGAVSMTSYLTQGYYGLSLALKEPFVWTYGFGHGFFTAEASRRIFGQGYILERTYTYRIDQDYGWPMMHNWSTAYTCLASDLTFPGTIVAMFFIGYLFARVWLDTLGKENPFAAAFLSYMILFIFSLPGGNQILSFYKSAIPFWVLLGFWFLTRVKGAFSVSRVSAARRSLVPRGSSVLALPGKSN